MPVKYERASTADPLNVLVTGASGFIGGRLMQALDNHPDFIAVGAVRSGKAQAGNRTVVGSVDSHTDWSMALASVQVVIHTAARVHVMNDHTVDPLQAFREVNVAGTLNLARQAASRGVQRFVFISSIKVNGESTRRDERFTAEDTPAPMEPYGISKCEAEQGLTQIAAETGMEVVIIRPPLVYGKGVKGNFARMIGWANSAIPLPLGALDNRRSMIGLDNLVDLMITCATHPSAANQVFLASDDDDLTVPDVLGHLAAGLGRPVRLFPLPVYLLKTVAVLLGKRPVANRLLQSLQVDISKTRAVLGWVPPVSVREGLRRCVAECRDE